MELVDQGSRVLVSDGNNRTIGVLGLDEADKPMKTWRVPVGCSFFPAPLWNAEQKLIVAVVSGHSVERTFWVFNVDLDLIEKVDAAPLEELWWQSKQKRQNFNHRYAWVMERLRNPPGPGGNDFPIKSHTLENKRISHEEASGIW
jgi:hypothetical protein